ncbi:hypothetical protein R1sor_000436 [Riccia sorocarpa]|uniref:Uncharacterized protein n=1 Tax=Riccia sorocarpa TaxID=122646 RepID=A0ABD3GZ34_9MARC
MSPTKKPERKRVRHLEFETSLSDEDNRGPGPSNTSPLGFKLGAQTKDEDLQQIERRDLKTSMFFNVTEVFAEAQRVLTRLSALTSAEAEIVKLKKKLEESQHEVKRARRKMKSSSKKKNQLKEKVKAKDQQLIEAEDIASFAENEVEVQRRVFVRKFLGLVIDKTSTKNFEQVTEVLDATKSQPDNQQERHADEMGEKVQTTYEDFAHTIT